MQVPQPYVPNTVSKVTQSSKEEATQVGNALDTISTEVSDPNLKESLLKTSANYKFMGNNGTFNQSYLQDQTKQYGFVSNVIGGVKNAANKVGKFIRGGKPKKSDVEGLRNWGNDQYDKNKSKPQPSNQPMTQVNPQPTQTSPTPQPKLVNQATPPPANPQPNPVPQPNVPTYNHINDLDRGVGEVNDTLTEHRNLVNTTVNNPNLMNDPNQLFNSGNVENALIDRFTTVNGIDDANVVNKKGRINEGATDYMQEGIYNNSYNAANHWYMDKTTGNVNENWRKAGQQALKNATPMQKKDNQFLSQIARTYSNNKMIKLDNIRFFSDSSKEIIVKMYADQLSEEEIQKALKWKNRKQKLIKALKTIGGIGLAGAALYGGAKWYQNGGKDYLSKIGDSTSDFLTKTGDAAVDAGKGIGDATKDEADRIATKLAEKQLEGKEDKEVKDNTESPDTNMSKDESPKEDKGNYEYERLKSQFMSQLSELDSRMNAINIKIDGYRNDIINKYKSDSDWDRKSREVAENQINLLNMELDRLKSEREEVYASMGRLTESN